jgi:hypothetical protein
MPSNTIKYAHVESKILIIQPPEWNQPKGYSADIRVFLGSAAESLPATAQTIPGGRAFIRCEALFSDEPKGGIPLPLEIGDIVEFALEGADVRILAVTKGQSVGPSLKMVNVLAPPSYFPFLSYMPSSLSSRAYLATGGFAYKIDEEIAACSASIWWTEPAEGDIPSRMGEFLPEPDDAPPVSFPVAGHNGVPLIQPLWDLNNPVINDPSNDLPKTPTEDIRDGWDIPVRDPLAWYVPASPASIKSRLYGIHFNASLILRECNQICASNPKLSGLEDKFLTAFTLMVFWHEVAHGWIQDMSFAADVVGNRGPLKNWPLNPEPNYFRVGARYGGLILMEEAICNTAALNMMSWWLNHRPWFKDIRPYIVEYMRGQTTGYKDFIDGIPGVACAASLFEKNILCLLTNVYAHNQHSAAEVGRLYMNSSRPEVDPRNDAAREIGEVLAKSAPWTLLRTCPMFFHGVTRI